MTAPFGKDKKDDLHKRTHIACLDFRLFNGINYPWVFRSQIQRKQRYSRRVNKRMCKANGKLWPFYLALPPCRYVYPSVRQAITSRQPGNAKAAQHADRVRHDVQRVSSTLHANCACISARISRWVVSHCIWPHVFRARRPRDTRKD